MPRCTFCGIQIPKGTGKLYVYSSGKTANFCKSKCEKNFLGVKRKPLEVRWTDQYRKEHKKDQKTEKAEETKEKAEDVKEEQPAAQVEEKPAEPAKEAKVEEETAATEKPAEIPESEKKEKDKPKKE
tara:strand:+ start:1914 stop:2294 length:381 start_codon:yes stop_codon:yes gene_type:complete